MTKTLLILNFTLNRLNEYRKGCVKIKKKLRRLKNLSKKEK